MVYGGANYMSSRSNNDQVRHSGLKEAWSIDIKIKRDAQGKGMALLGFSFTGLKVFVERPGYRIDSRTIKRAFDWVTWSHYLRELNHLHTLLLPTLFLIGVSLCEVLELVATFPTSPRSLKMEIVCIFYRVFEFGGFTGSFLREVFTSPYLLFYRLLLLGFYGLHWIDIFFSFSKSPSLLKSEFGWESYCIFCEDIFCRFWARFKPKIWLKIKPEIWLSSDRKPSGLISSRLSLNREF
jgi:hypothetical protein